MKFIYAVALVFVLLISSTVWADAGIFTGTGQDLKQISTEAVQLVSIDVKITLERGPGLFDGGAQGEQNAHSAIPYADINGTLSREQAC